MTPILPHDEILVVLVRVFHQLSAGLKSQDRNTLVVLCWVIVESCQYVFESSLVFLNLTQLALILRDCQLGARSRAPQNLTTWENRLLRYEAEQLFLLLSDM